MDIIENKNIFTNAATFCRLVELGSFTAVAKKLQVNQSTISRRVIALEQELNAQLIKRDSRAIAGHVEEPPKVSNLSFKMNYLLFSPIVTLRCLR